MTSDPRYNHLREQSWRRKLTIAEEAELRVWQSNHPDAQPDSEAEAALTEMLGHLPEAPVPSNFTARVLQAIEPEETGKVRQDRARWRDWLILHRWLPRLAFGCLLVGTGLFSYRHHYVGTVQRLEDVRSVRTVSAVSSLPSPEILKDFEAVRALRRTGPDEELLALLQ
jgi:hypothetical protein